MTRTLVVRMAASAERGLDNGIAVSSQGPSGYVVKVTGPIYVGNVARLQEALLDALIATPSELIIDLRSASSIDGPGPDVLVGAHRRAIAARTQLMFRNSNARGGPSHRTQRP